MGLVRVRVSKLTDQEVFDLAEMLLTQKEAEAGNNEVLDIRSEEVSETVYNKMKEKFGEVEE